MSYDDLGYGKKKPMHERTVVYSGRQILMTSNTQSTVNVQSQDEKPIYAGSSIRGTPGLMGHIGTESSAWGAQDWIGSDNSGDWDPQDEWRPN